MATMTIGKRKLKSRIMIEASVDENGADKILNETLNFLDYCAENPEGNNIPSKSADIGWHVFILHTADYAEFCNKLAGRFIHHNPYLKNGHLTCDNPR